MKFTYNDHKSPKYLNYSQMAQIPEAAHQLSVAEEEGTSQKTRTALSYVHEKLTHSNSGIRKGN